MRYRKLSPTGDYQFGNSQADFYRDVPEAPGQAVKTRLTLWVGEWYLNILSGTPYLQNILGKKRQEQADAAVQDRALRTLGVTSLGNYESRVNENTRKLSITFDVNTEFGPTEVEVENYANF